MIVADPSSKAITLQNVKSHPKYLKSIVGYQSLRVIVPSTTNFDIQVEEYKDNFSSRGHENAQIYITYKLNRKQIKVETFVKVLNGCELLSENKYFLKLKHYFFSKDSEYIYIFFEHCGGENFYELIQNTNFSLNEKQAKTAFARIAKAMTILETTYSNKIPEFVLLSMNIYLDFNTDPQNAKAFILPFDFLSSRSDLELNDIPKKFLLSPEYISVLASEAKKQPKIISLKKSNVYILGLSFLQILRGKKIMGQAERDREIAYNPAVDQIGPNDEIIKDHLDKLVVKGKKNELILVLQQCLIFNILERISIQDIIQMCKSPLLFLKNKQLVGEMRTKAKEHDIQTKAYQTAFQNALDQIQRALHECKGDVQYINQQFNIVKQEFDSQDAPVSNEITDTSNQFLMDLSNQELMDETMDRGKSLFTEKLDRTTTFESNLDFLASNFRGTVDTRKNSEFISNKIKKIRNDNFYNPHGMVSSNHKIQNFQIGDKEQKSVFWKRTSIIDGDVVGVYTILAINEYLLATGGDDSSIKIWHIEESHIECIQTLIGHSNSVHSLCLLQHSKIIASGSSGETASIKIWNILDGTCIKTLKGHTDTISSICQINEDLIASGCFDSTIRIWHWSSGKCEKILQHHNFAILCLCTINDTTIASGSDDCSIMIWNISKGILINDIQGHNSWVQSIIFLKQYNQLVSCSGDGTVRIWSQVGQQEHMLNDHSGQANSLLYLEEKDLLISAGSDQTINIYRFQSKKLLQKIEDAHKDSILSLACIGNILVTSGIDSTISQWAPIIKPSSKKQIPFLSSKLFKVHSKEEQVSIDVQNL